MLRRCAARLAIPLTLVLTAAACTSGDGPFIEFEPDDTVTTRQAGDGDGDAGDGGDDIGDPGDGAFFEVEGQPPPLRQSLAQLDSYRLAMTIKAEGSGFEETALEIAVEYSRADDAWHQTLTEAGEVTTETYWKAGVACVRDEDVFSPSELAVQDRDFFGLVWNQLDIVPVVADPVLVGREEYSGVTADHYTFTVPGLGLESGAVATESSGEYWVAEDGYLVGYRLALETSTGPPDDPASEVVGGEMLITVTDINAPISIQPPPECAVTLAPPPPAGVPTGPADSDVPRPPPLRRSLAQLDSYRVSLDLVLASPSLGSATINAQLEAGADGVHQTLRSTAEGETTTTEAYWTGSLACTFDGDTWTPAEVGDQEREFLGAFGNLIDVVPVVTDPVEVGDEDFAGIPATHYTFTLAGLTSGTATTHGEYWLARDGGYLLGYRAELASGSGAEAASGRLSITLSDVNAPVAIEPPPECTLPPPTTTTEAPATTEAPTTTEVPTTTTEAAADVFDADVAAILALWAGYSASWAVSNEAGVQYILDNNYPGLAGTFAECFDTFFPDGPDPAFTASVDVDPSSIVRDDGWVMPAGLLAGTVPDGRIYLMAVVITETSSGADPVPVDANVHVTMLPEARFFLNCPG